MTTAIAIAGILTVGALGSSTADAQQQPAGLELSNISANSIEQEWEIREGRLSASLTVSVSAEEGDSFELLRSPAVLTSFEGEGLQLRKREAGGAAIYLLTPESAGTFTAKATYEMPLPAPLEDGVLVPTGRAAVQTLELTIDQAGWEIASAPAVRIEPLEDVADGQSGARLVLQPQHFPTIKFRLAGRDVESEETRFFAEVSNAFVCGPGVVDASHSVIIRPSQGRVSRLKMNVPAGFTVSAVSSPVSQWRFDPDSRELTADVQPAQTSPFQVLVESQMTTGTLPVNVDLAALTVDGASGQTGKVGLAFTSDSQPEGINTTTLSPVNARDFPVSLLGNDKRAATEQVSLRHAYHFSETGGAVALTVAPVNPEVRVNSTKVLSLGEERLVFAIDYVVDITRAGLFRLTVPLPDGFDIEGVSGSALSHWLETTEEDGQRVATLHLNGRTLGRQTFSLSLSSPAPGAQVDWSVPRIQLREATRSTGQLTISPERGIRIRPKSRVSASPLDNREQSSGQPGTLAFKLLKSDWQVVLDIEELDSWVTARTLQEVTLREGVTQTRLAIRYKIENAGVKTLRLTLPGLSADEQNSVRANGKDVNEIVKAPNVADTWDLQFRRSVLGETNVEIEYQSASQHGGNGTETLAVPVLEGVRQSATFVAVRASGRLDLQSPTFPAAWQLVDWIAVPEELRNPADTSVPAMVARVADPFPQLPLGVRRHAVADSLKLRVFQGQLTSVLATDGSVVSEASLDVEVVEQSTMQLSLPPNAQLFSVFVNGLSVNTVVEGNAYRFYVKAREDSPTAEVRITWSSKTDVSSGNWNLQGPNLGIPLENVTWRIIVPDGFDFDFGSGTLQQVKGDIEARSFTLAQYEDRRRSRKAIQEQQAIALLNRASSYLQQGEQEKARSVLQLASESPALDDASNEDARVQLRALQTQQAVVGLNTRRQRFYLDNGGAVEFGIERNEQLEQSALKNPLMRGDVNYDPTQVDALLAGNSMQETSALKRMASRLVKQQQAAEPASQAIESQLPEHGQIYKFARSVQASGGAPLELNFSLSQHEEPTAWKAAAVLVGILLLFGLALGATSRRSEGTQAKDA